MPVVSELYRYPVKSTQGEALDRSPVSFSGLPYDRNWMVADANGRMITGRTDPRLVKVIARTDGSVLHLHAQGLPDLQVTLAAFSNVSSASVWKDDFPAWAGSAQADKWLSDLLGKPVRLLYAGEASLRRVRVQPQTPLGFADGYPLLLIGQGSLDDLNRRIGQRLSMRRFRPNLVVAGAMPFAEDTWKRIRIGDAIFELAKPCERCVFTTVDPESGEKSSDQEPLRTLATFRKTEAGVLFGQNLLVEQAGEIACGMEVEILEAFQP